MLEGCNAKQWESFPAEAGM